MNKWGIFALGALAGVAAVSIAKTSAFKKACAAVVSQGIQLRNDAAAFAESVKEDAQDMAAEAQS